MLAADEFERTVASGFGSADTGGGWTVVGSGASVGVGRGRMVLGQSGAQVTATLPTVAGTAVDAVVDASIDRAATGSGPALSLVGRRVGSADYRARVRWGADGAVTLTTVRVSGGETTLRSVPVAGLTAAPGDVLRVRLQVTGTAPTTVRARVWRAGATEPTTWAAESTDATAGLQQAGGVGLVGYLPGSATGTPLTVAVDHLSVVAP
ncbi:hypothetical protein GCM10025868_14780 [Angustibacter aerolatus]|uniref:Htaa domain-containing protein n=1 Tax=Angustibacter aerolatus TaxID=1162965 RepID=A0ABQ6JDG9_9ACTN|nr:hypothetical protein GCM10025868_14780 [Angustibacter aerolatus]